MGGGAFFAIGRFFPVGRMSCLAMFSWATVRNVQSLQVLQCSASSNSPAQEIRSHEVALRSAI